MPPNVLLWDESSASNPRFRQLHCDHKDNTEDSVDIDVTSNLERPCPSSGKREYDKASVWQEWLVTKQTPSSSNMFENDLVADAFSSILVMDDEIKDTEWLDRFGGRLSVISEDLLAALR